MKFTIFCIATVPKSSCSLILLLALGGAACNGSIRQNDNASAEAAIRNIEEEWAHTAVTGDTGVIKRIFADDFLGTSPEGELYTKQQFIDEMKANSTAFKSNNVNDIKVRFFENVAVAQGNETFTRLNGETARFVWTDVLVKRDGEWKLVAAEDLIAPVGTSPNSDHLFTKPAAKENTGVDSCRKAYVTAWLSADADRIGQVYTKNAVVMYPNLEPINGRSSIIDYFKGFFKEFKQEKFELESQEIQIVGQMAFDRGKYKWRGMPRNGGAPVDDEGKYLVVLEQQPDGQWRVARDMDNSNRPSAQNTRNAN